MNYCTSDVFSMLTQHLASFCVQFVVYWQGCVNIPLWITIAVLARIKHLTTVWKVVGSCPTRCFSGTYLSESLVSLPAGLVLGPQASGLVPKQTYLIVTQSRACLGMFMWYLWDGRPLYCHWGLQLWVFTSVDQQLCADEGRWPYDNLFHTRYCSLGMRCISYTQTWPTLNLPTLHTDNINTKFIKPGRHSLI